MNTFVKKKIILLAIFWSELEEISTVITCVKKQQEIKILAIVFAICFSLTYTNERKLFYYLSLCGFCKDALYRIIEKHCTIESYVMLIVN